MPKICFGARRQNELSGLLAGRREAGGAPLACNSTMNRLELGAGRADRYRKTHRRQERFDALMVELFLGGACGGAGAGGAGRGGDGNGRSTMRGLWELVPLMARGVLPGRKVCLMARQQPSRSRTESRIELEPPSSHLQVLPR